MPLCHIALLLLSSSLKQLLLCFAFMLLLLSLVTEVLYDAATAPRATETLVLVPPFSPL